MYFATVFTTSMAPAGHLDIADLTPAQAAGHLQASRAQEGLINIANPSHANTLAAIGQVLGVDVASDAQGRRVRLVPGDSCLVAELDASKLPRETREFTDEEIAQCGLVFRLVIVGMCPTAAEA